MTNITGWEVPRRSNEVFVKKGPCVFAFPKSVGALKTNVAINPENSALIQKGNQVVYTISMTQSNNGANQEDTIMSALKKGLTVPIPEIFMSHYRNANMALKGESVLYDALGNLIDGDRLKEYVNGLNLNSSPYPWVWLNGKFVKGSGFNGLDLEIITGLNEERQPIFKRFPLKSSLKKECYAKLDSLNSQGFPTRRASVPKFEPGETFYFYPPKEGAVPRFSAHFNGASLNCQAEPMLFESRVGAFTCAEVV